MVACAKSDVHDCVSPPAAVVVVLAGAGRVVVVVLVELDVVVDVEVDVAIVVEVVDVDEELPAGAEVPEGLDVTMLSVESRVSTNPMMSPIASNSTALRAMMAISRPRLLFGGAATATPLGPDGGRFQARTRTRTTRCGSPT